MNEILIVFLILLISYLMFGTIMLILKADKKLLEINQQVEKIKTTDLKNLRKIVSVLNKINKYVQFDKIKQAFEVAMTMMSAINLLIVLKKLRDKKIG